MYEDETEEDSGGESSGGERAVGAKARLHEQVFSELMHEVKHGPPGARLSARLRTALERMSPEERRAVVSRMRGGCAPLFVAARRGATETVEYLVHVCAASLEQRGLYRAPDETAAHRVTPLWAAAVAGRLGALRALADAGADLDARSDSGSTPVRSACFMTHLDAVRLLCERGADIHAPNHHGGTCLINGVQSPRLCRYLLERGARPDARDAQLKTALHYAIQEHRADTARLLLDAGADPRLRSRAGDDALRTACARGAAPIVSLLCARATYSPARLASAHELLGATQLDEFDDAAAALASWRRATEIRRAGGRSLRKRPARGAVAALGGGAREWRSAAELEALAGDADAMRSAALLVAARVLGAHHKDALFRVMYRGAAYADARRYARGAELWAWALARRARRDTLLAADACHAACALARLLADARADPGAGADAPDFPFVLRVLAIVAEAIPECQRLVAIRPVCAAQAECWERVLRCAVYLALLAGDAAGRGAAERAAVRSVLAPLVRARPVTAAGDSLLHLACSRLTAVRSSYFAERAPAAAAFPSAAAARLLLEAGADPRARNLARGTPLHAAAAPYNREPALVATLLAAGAHLDTPNALGDSPADLLPLCRGTTVCPLRHTTLACLAARALLRAGAAPPPPPDLPATLRDFLDLHRP